LTVRPNDNTNSGLSFQAKEQKRRQRGGSESGARGVLMDADTEATAVSSSSSAANMAQRAETAAPAAPLKLSLSMLRVTASTGASSTAGGSTSGAVRDTADEDMAGDDAGEAEQAQAAAAEQEEEVGEAGNNEEEAEGDGGDSEGESDGSEVDVYAQARAFREQLQETQYGGGEDDGITLAQQTAWQAGEGQLGSAVVAGAEEGLVGDGEEQPEDREFEAAGRVPAVATDPNADEDDKSSVNSEDSDAWMKEDL
jgi:hypothetical protein